MIAGLTLSFDLPGGQKTVDGYDFWLVRTDAAGKLQWNHTYGGTGYEEAQALTVLADGGLALADYAESDDLPGGQKGAGGQDFWLVRTDPWSHASCTDAGPCATKKLADCDDGNACTDDGCAKATGCTHANNTAPCSDGEACTVADACKGGVCVAGPGKVFSATYGGPSGDYAKALTVLADGGLALAGSTQSSDLPGGKESVGKFDCWLVHTDAGGKLLWSQTYGGTAADQAYGIVALSNGDFALAGWTDSTDLPGGQKSVGHSDVWLVRTDAGGKLLWSQTYGGVAGNDQARAVTALTDGGLALAGYTESPNLPGGQKSAGNHDFWLLRTDASGQLLWNQTYGGSAHDDAFAITGLPDGRLVLAGHTQSTDLPGGQKTAGGYDFYLLSTDPWGHASCADAGGCAAKKPADCDDNNACTADLCDAKAGCTHAPLADGSACGGVKACKSGECAPAAPDAMALIPGGNFKVGCVWGDNCGAAEKPQHDVTLDGFFVDVREVSVAKYAACVLANKCSAAGTSTGQAAFDKYCNWAKAGKEQHPVNCMTWFQAEAYCKWAGSRLPTEAEWEKAARGGLDDKKFPWGSQPATCTPGQVNTAVFGGSQDAGCNKDSTWEVGTGSAKNGFGLYDMAGNVSEWAADWFKADYYVNSPATNPTGPATGVARAYRGGGFYGAGGGAIMGSSFRDGIDPSGSSFLVGFRCARSFPSASSQRPCTREEPSLR